MTTVRGIQQALGASRIHTARIHVVNADGTAVIERDAGECFPAAVLGGIALRAGDEVLVAVGEDGLHYVLGALARPPSPSVDSVATRDGARAERVVDAAGERLEVRDARGRLVFEHRIEGEGEGERARSVVYAEGDLAFSAPNGAIEFAARDAVRMRSEGSLELSAKRRAEFNTPVLDARVRDVDVSSETVDVTAKVITTTAERARHVVGVLETTAVRILERARNVYRDAEELSQTRAGRMKLVVRETLSALSRRTVLKSEKDTRLDGEKIYLG